VEQLPEGVDESDLFNAYANDCVYNEREVELWRQKWRDIPVKERPCTGNSQVTHISGRSRDGKRPRGPAVQK